MYLEAESKFALLYGTGTLLHISNWLPKPAMLNSQSKGKLLKKTWSVSLAFEIDFPDILPDLSMTNIISYNAVFEWNAGGEIKNKNAPVPSRCFSIQILNQWELWVKNKERLV